MVVVQNERLEVGTEEGKGEKKKRREGGDQRERREFTFQMVTRFDLWQQEEAQSGKRGRGWWRGREHYLREERKISSPLLLQPSLHIHMHVSIMYLDLQESQ